MDRRKFSMDSEQSVLEDAVQKPNFKCGRFGCYHKFFIASRENTILCPECGYRIILKLRTRNHITYKTE